MVASGRPIREANQDSEAAGRARIGLSRFAVNQPLTRGFSVLGKQFLFGSLRFV